MKDWTWYAAGAAIIGPFFLVAVLEQDWLGRLIGISAVYIGFPAVLLWFTLGPKRNLGSEGRTIWPEYITKHFGDKIYIGTRLLLAVFAGIFFYLVTFPFAIDVTAVIRGDAPLSGTGIVREVSGSSVAGLISQTVVFEQSISLGSNNKFRTAYFLIGSIKYGETYEYIYLPKTRTILEVAKIHSN